MQLESQRKVRDEIMQRQKDIEREKHEFHQRRLKTGFENMLKFENERMQEQQRREKMRKDAHQQRIANLANNYNQASKTRIQHTQQKQQKMFRDASMQKELNYKSNQAMMNFGSKLSHVNQNIEILENMEKDMLHNLEQTINEHEKLLRLTDSNYASKLSAQNSLRKINLSNLDKTSESSYHQAASTRNIHIMSSPTTELINQQ